MQKQETKTEELVTGKKRYAELLCEFYPNRAFRDGGG